MLSTRVYAPNAAGSCGRCGDWHAALRTSKAQILVMVLKAWLSNGSRLSCGASAGRRKRPGLRYRLAGAQAYASFENQPRQLQALVRRPLARGVSPDEMRHARCSETRGEAKVDICSEFYAGFKDGPGGVTRIVMNGDRRARLVPPGTLVCSTLKIPIVEGVGAKENTVATVCDAFDVVGIRHLKVEEPKIVAAEPAGAANATRCELASRVRPVLGPQALDDRPQFVREPCGSGRRHGDGLKHLVCQ